MTQGSDGRPGGAGQTKSAKHIITQLIAAVPSHKRATYDPGDVLYREDESPETVFVIMRGMVKLVSYLPNGRARIVRLHGAGSILGFDALLGMPCGHNAIAVNAVDCIRIGQSAISPLRDERPELYSSLVEALYTHLQVADKWITEFSTGPIKARVARLLAFLSEVEDDTKGDEVALLTCEEMAEILGVTAESVSRVLAEFKREAILRPIDGRGSDVYEHDSDGLRSVANEDS